MLNLGFFSSGCYNGTMSMKSTISDQCNLDSLSRDCIKKNECAEKWLKFLYVHTALTSMESLWYNVQC